MVCSDFSVFTMVKTFSLSIRQLEGEFLSAADGVHACNLCKHKLQRNYNVVRQHASRMHWDKFEEFLKKLGASEQCVLWFTILIYSRYNLEANRIRALETSF